MLDRETSQLRLYLCGKSCSRSCSKVLEPVLMLRLRMTNPLSMLQFLPRSDNNSLTSPWETFVAYWDDFCHPSSDDAFVFPQDGTNALAWNHSEVFDFIQNAV